MPVLKTVARRPKDEKEEHEVVSLTEVTKIRPVAQSTEPGLTLWKPEKDETFEEKIYSKTVAEVTSSSYEATEIGRASGRERGTSPV